MRAHAPLVPTRWSTLTRACAQHTHIETCRVRVQARAHTARRLRLTRGRGRLGAGLTRHTASDSPGPAAQLCLSACQSTGACRGGKGRGGGREEGRGRGKGGGGGAACLPVHSRLHLTCPPLPFSPLQAPRHPGPALGLAWARTPCPARLPRRRPASPLRAVDAEHRGVPTRAARGRVRAARRRRNGDGGLLERRAPRRAGAPCARACGRRPALRTRQPRPRGAGPEPGVSVGCGRCRARRPCLPARRAAPLRVFRLTGPDYTGLKGLEGDVRRPWRPASARGPARDAILSRPPRAAEPCPPVLAGPYRRRARPLGKARAAAPQGPAQGGSEGVGYRPGTGREAKPSIKRGGGRGPPLLSRRGTPLLSRPLDKRGGTEHAPRRRGKRGATRGRGALGSRETQGAAARC
jgi:hypothetical protein